MSDRVDVLSNQPGRIVRMISIPLDRPHDRPIPVTRTFARICGMVRELLGPGGGLEQDTSISD